LFLGAAALLSGCGGDAARDVVSPRAAVTTLDVQVRVFTPRCALSGCHVGAGAPFGLDLSSSATSAANLVRVPSAEMPELARVAPGDAPNSYLYRKVSGDPNILGDAMPLSGAPLGPAELALIETWIEQGAL
jgi:hypothetical protein